MERPCVQPRFGRTRRSGNSAMASRLLPLRADMRRRGLDAAGPLARGPLRAAWLTGAWRATVLGLGVKAWTTKTLLAGKKPNRISLTPGAPFTTPSAAGRRAYTERWSQIRRALSGRKARYDASILRPRTIRSIPART